MTETTDPNMLKWWAQYTESTGNMEIALKIYQKAEDWFSQVKKHKLINEKDNVLLSVSPFLF